jgi:hypothetical protein
MRNHFGKSLMGCVLLSLLAGCAIRAPEVHVTGEKTALEREVVGTYHEMEEDTWMIASTRSTKGEGDVKISPEKQKVFEALREQKFNKDDIEEFKKKGYIGEDNRGLIQIRPSTELESDTQTMNLIQIIISEENRDRGIIMNRVIELNDSLKKSNQQEILIIFARMNQENSPKGTWIQQGDGGWEKK